MPRIGRKNGASLRPGADGSAARGPMPRSAVATSLGIGGRTRTADEVVGGPDALESPVAPGRKRRPPSLAGDRGVAARRHARRPRRRRLRRADRGLDDRSGTGLPTGRGTDRAGRHRPGGDDRPGGRHPPRRRCDVLRPRRRAHRSHAAADRGEAAPARARHERPGGGARRGRGHRRPRRPRLGRRADRGRPGAVPRPEPAVGRRPRRPRRSRRPAARRTAAAHRDGRGPLLRLLRPRRRRRAS